MTLRSAAAQAEALAAAVLAAAVQEEALAAVVRAEAAAQAARRIPERQRDYVDRAGRKSIHVYDAIRSCFD